MARWAREEIGDDQVLYLRVHQVKVLNGKLLPNAFDDHDGGMSTDWARYSTPEQSRNRARKPDLNGVVQMGVGSIRKIDELIVEHTPDEEFDNQAHTDVIGEKTVEVRVLLR